MHITRVQQMSESHCGPAVLQMLLDAVGVAVTQEAITRAANAEDTIEEHGVNVDQLALACTRLAPHMQFWYKFRSSLDDLRTVLHAGYVVGVEWQGLFYETAAEEAEDEDEDFGHYSVVSAFDEARQALIIVDPYKDFSDQDRILDASAFLYRWWDTNEVRHPVTRRRYIREDKQLLFFVTPQTEDFSPEHGFKRYASVAITSL